MFIFLTYLNITVAISTMMGFMGYLSFKITSITSIAPQMLFTIALADLIHLLISYKLYFKDERNRPIAEV